MDPKLDEGIIIPSYESSTLTIEKITEMQNALDRRKRQEILRKENKHKQALNDIKDIFMDAFSLQSLDESKPIMEKLLDIVDQVTNEDHDTNAKLIECSERKFQGKLEEEKEETKDEEQAAIQTLVEFPKTSTPTQTLQKLGNNMISLQVQTPGSSSTKVARILHYGDLEQDYHTSF